MHRLTLLFAAVLIAPVIALAGPESLAPSSGKEMKEVVPPPAPTCEINWTGFYVGLNGGWGWGDGDTRFVPLPNEEGFFGGALDTTSLDTDNDGFFGGGQIGFNWQMGHFVLGVETDFQGADIDGGNTEHPVPVAEPPPLDEGTFLHTSEQLNWFGTFRGRVGFTPFCRLMLYATGGLAYGEADYTGEVNFVSDGGPVAHTSFSETNVGWTAGAGLEYAINNRWSVKVEYLYIDLGDQSDTVVPEFITNSANSRVDYRGNGDGKVTDERVHFNWDTSAHTVRGGINFKF